MTTPMHLPPGTSAVTPLTSERQALRQEQERMAELLASLGGMGVSSALGKTPNTQRAPPTRAPTTSATVSRMSLPPATPSDAAAAAMASSAGNAFSPLRTVDRATPFAQHTGALPTATSTVAAAEESLASHSVIELMGELQEAKGALEAERIVSQRLTRQLAEMTTRMSTLTNERGNELTDARRAADAMRVAEEEAAAARGARDDALRRLAATQQSIAAARQASDYALAEARAQAEARVATALQAEARAQSASEEARAESQAKEAEVGGLRFEARQANDEIARLKSALHDAETHARRLAHQGHGATPPPPPLGRSGAPAGVSGGAPLELIGHTLTDLEAFTRALTRSDGVEAAGLNAAPNAAEAMSALARRGLDEAQSMMEQQIAQIGSLEAETVRLRAALAEKARSTGAGAGAPTTSAAAAAAVVRVGELEATVADLHAQLQRARTSARNARAPTAAPAQAAFEPGAVLRERTAILEAADATERATAASARAAKAVEAAQAESAKHAITRRQLDELREAAADSRGSALAASQEAVEVRAMEEQWRRRLEEAERRVAEHSSRADALEVERRAWRDEMAGDKARLRELEGSAGRHAKDKARLQAMVDDTRENAERRAAEAIAVREMSRDHMVAQAAKPSVELLRENERLRKMVDDLGREGERRAQETVAAMAARTEEVRTGGGANWGEGLSKMFRM